MTTELERARFVKAANEMLAIMRACNINHVSLFPRGSSEGSVHLFDQNEIHVDGYGISPADAWDALIQRRAAEDSLDEYGPLKRR